MRKYLILALILGGNLAWSQTEEKPSMTRMKYNHPGLIDDLAVGLWCWPVPVDADGDGKLDLVVSTECVPYNGTYSFRNTGKPVGGTTVDSAEVQPNGHMPLFEAGKKLSGGQINVQASFVEGKTVVLRPAEVYPDYARTGLQHPRPLPLPANVHPNGVRGNMWKYLDFDGDGRLDVAIGTDDWKPYGWADAYDAYGKWKNDQSHGNVYIVLNEGTNEEPKYGKPFLLRDCFGRAILTYGWPCPNFVDFDGDGDLDLLCGEFKTHFTYFENIGTREKPNYAPGVFTTYEDGTETKEDLCMITPVVLDWTGDGRPDILCGNEDGRVSFYENAGTFHETMVTGVTVRVPIFKHQQYFQQEADELKSGSLVTPCCVDWNGDGAIDILAGNSAGFIVFFENLSDPGEEFPRWNRPVYLQADGKVIKIIAEPNGSIQGPIEDRYGYTVLTVADWDGDGLPDLMVNSTIGSVVWFRNIGTKTEPKLAAAEAVEVEWEGTQPELAWGWMKPDGQKLLTQWRTTPVMFDVNADGLMDLCMLDTEGYFAFFERYREADGTLKLKSPQRVFYWENGDLMQLNKNKAGGSGRRKICMNDFNGDGKFDLLVNSMNADLLIQTRAENGRYFFNKVGTIAKDRLAGHSTSPTSADFNNDGTPDFVLGAEDGRIYYLRNTLQK
ncbi:MAG: VCBS repeat-containing protein [Planctomycetia bacterium]|nr:VCBS repeat-containing protein [Planctomycetia bacterium]